VAAGEVIRFNSGKGYGFIRCDSGGDDVLLHASALVPGIDASALQPGTRLVFDVRQTSRGLRAANVRLPLDEGCQALSEFEFRAEMSEALREAEERLVAFARRRGWVG
jgi:cold shock CspA family protein